MNALSRPLYNCKKLETQRSLLLRDTGEQPPCQLLAVFFLGAANLNTSLVTWSSYCFTGVSCDQLYCFISRHAQCGIVLLSVCTVQVSVQVSQSRQPKCQATVCTWLKFAIAGMCWFLHSSFFKAKYFVQQENVEEHEKLWNLSKGKRHTLAKSRKLWENIIYGA